MRRKSCANEGALFGSVKKACVSISAANLGAGRDHLRFRLIAFLG
jgi:hypothetical protein